MSTENTENSNDLTETTVAVPAVTFVTAAQIQQLRAGILRLRLRVEGVENRAARIKRAVTALSEELGWEHAALLMIDDEITKLDAARERLLADLDGLKAALRAREQELAAQLAAQFAQVG